MEFIKLLEDIEIDNKVVACEGDIGIEFENNLGRENGETKILRWQLVRSFALDSDPIVELELDASKYTYCIKDDLMDIDTAKGYLYVAYNYNAKAFEHKIDFSDLVVPKKVKDCLGDDYYKICDDTIRLEVEDLGDKVCNLFFRLVNSFEIVGKDYTALRFKDTMDFMSNIDNIEDDTIIYENALLLGIMLVYIDFEVSKIKKNLESVEYWKENCDYMSPVTCTECGSPILVDEELIRTIVKENMNLVKKIIKEFDGE